MLDGHVHRPTNEIQIHEAEGEKEGKRKIVRDIKSKHTVTQREGQKERFSVIGTLRYT